MEELLDVLDREARLFQNTEAAAILADWRIRKRMTCEQVYAASKMRKAAAERERARLAKIAARDAAYDAKRDAAARAADIERAHSDAAAKLGRAVTLKAKLAALRAGREQ